MTDITRESKSRLSSRSDRYLNRRLKSCLLQLVKIGTHHKEQDLLFSQKAKYTNSLVLMANSKVKVLDAMGKEIEQMDHNFLQYIQQAREETAHTITTHDMYNKKIIQKQEELDQLVSNAENSTEPGHEELIQQKINNIQQWSAICDDLQAYVNSMDQTVSKNYEEYEKLRSDKFDQYSLLKKEHSCLLEDVENKILKTEEEEKQISILHQGWCHFVALGETIENVLQEYKNVINEETYHYLLTRIDQIESFISSVKL